MALMASFGNLTLPLWHFLCCTLEPRHLLFVLVNSSFISAWSSFNNPTHTVVPLQNFIVIVVLRSDQYYFKLFDIGKLARTRSDDAIYWNQGLSMTINVSQGADTIVIRKVDTHSTLCVFLPLAPSFLVSLLGTVFPGGGNESKNFAWHAVASWTWNAQDETCGICRMAFDGCCPDCKLPGDDCPLIWGACNHAFHLHCILKWVNSQTSQAHCPMCRREWQFKG
ncbi:unnamed protein product [Citrullus colocynthis]|uniref:Anaphase-promoting complex subunit 11 n=1 Tax=Citrullus colocynthis TaxID=252529 RepID=A0ABP0XQ85_9ROSI